MGDRGSTSKEQNNQKQGRTGSGTPMKKGIFKPVHNPTKNGGINQATRK